LNVAPAAVQAVFAVPDLAIKDVAELTGIAAGTIRMWEQRYGFPTPGRTASGYRRYSDDDVDVLRKVMALRHRGLSVPAAIERAQEHGGPTDHPSIYAAVAGSGPGLVPQVLRKSTLVALSRAIEHEALAHAAAPVLFGAFQQERFYRQVEHRYRRLAKLADAAAVFADFGAARHPRGGPAELPVGAREAIGDEWAVIVHAPGGAGDARRRFEAIWTVDPQTTRQAADVAARLAARADPAYGERVLQLLADRPLATEAPAPALTALTNRIVGYLEA
jgi:MerR family transcriptional regulator, light-induced transcriptional regulator